ncbi:Sodium-dependent serotonin transporter,Sodium-dependent dopamine transporter,Sodium-and chloride-dependent glycine transporter 2,Sodium-dependent noradrenaline transporter [Mytilus edulis]|uniref:Sodium-dependent serotonin transporter,Sodium-dependent dopamine transporter,Sodium-and chloride-dependent glycine transporter 2,Sodium-dependent noradrenaline transporter n=1 Tax=Mytilus edulis TaxID=6550 RepID=A0A8S3T366_MYTED|nr:Sodium-dependent serotonin transporter,Sodium-dependent dopamine transporter,Sodium-and chloride-dependent glycine transporter 2,Sodium-dependent noradrenaline transporter [Mytilus edulis]
MLIFGGLPLFYMELALGQFQRCGCLTVWKRICPALKGIGLAIVVIATYVSWYYNTIIAWAVFYFFSAMASDVPWKSCNNSWNSIDKCVVYEGRGAVQNTIDSKHLLNISLENNANNSVTLNPLNLTIANVTNITIVDDTKTATEEFFEYQVLGLNYADALEDVGGVNWILALCLFGVFIIVYFAMWRGVKSSGKAVWITATMPYAVLIILLVRGCMLSGSWKGIMYYLTPDWNKLLETRIWIAAAAQIFFSLGPGFGVLLALSSYNKLDNNCYRDALLTSTINCITSFLAGFVVFSVLGHMSHMSGKTVDNVARDDVGLIFIVYPEALSSLELSPFWAILFFFMLITLGLDTTGGIYVVQLLDVFGAPISIIFVVFLESVAVSWIYGVERFSNDIQSMLGFRPGIFWRICWTTISPLFLFTLFIMSLAQPMPPQYGTYDFPTWSYTLGWFIVSSSLLCIPGYAIYLFFVTPGSMAERLRSMVVPTEVPNHSDDVVIPVQL